MKRTSSNENMPTHLINEVSSSINIKSSKPKETSQPRQIPNTKNSYSRNDNFRKPGRIGKPIQTNSWNDISYSYGKLLLTLMPVWLNS